MSSNALALYTPERQVELSKGVWEYAVAIAGTDFVPKAMRGKADAVLACMMKGSEVGLPLMQSLSSIHVIEGRPTMSAESMRAVVQSRGHEIWIVESTSTRCTVGGKRDGSTREQKFTWTIDDARAAGLNGKDVWKKYPAAMLLARATGALCRAVFADCLAGISYTREELDDGYGIDVDEPVEPVASEAPAPKRTTARARQAATRGAAATTPDAPVESPQEPARGEVPPLPGEEDIVDAEIVTDADPTEAAGTERPPLPDEEPPHPASDDGGGSRMSGPARIAMLMGQHGVHDRVDKLRGVRQIVGREVGSSNDLKPDEMSTVIAFLNGLAEGEAFPFEDVGEGVPVPVVNSPDAKAAEAEETSAAVPAPPPSQRAAGPIPDQWDGDAWRAFVKKRGMKASQIIPEVKRLAALQGLQVVTLDEIAGTGIADDVIGWIEDNTVSKP